MDEILELARGLREEGKIDIILLARKLGLKVFSMSDLKDIFKNAYIKKEGEEFSIYVNPDQTKQRQRFSIAHEIAHFCLHKKQLEELGIIDRDSDKSLSPTLEREADRLAANILMPEDDIKAILGDPSKDTEITKDKIEELAQRYGVSNPAIVVRLRELKYYVPFIRTYGE